VQGPFLICVPKKKSNVRQGTKADLSHQDVRYFCAIDIKEAHKDKLIDVERLARRLQEVHRWLDLQA
jgi:hypothetical protein